MAKFDYTYVSDFTRFMNAYLAEHPEVVVDQQRGRAIYWDKQPDLDQQQRMAQSTVPVDSYYYFGNP